ncbi:trimethylamine-N-oxide reductase [Salmonella enterica subsp. enterica]|nr:trimethylamine-N-oxide reductase [Salmonella enterica subsp. enterica]
MEARNDFDIFRDLCRRFNREAAFTEGLDEMGWLKRIWQEGSQQGKRSRYPLTDFRGVLESNRSTSEFDHPQMFVRHQAFREDPDLEPLGTPSGLIEIYSKTIADMQYDDCQGHPMWFEKIERSHGGPGSQRWPLHLQSVHPDSVCIPNCASRKRCVSNMPLAARSRSLLTHRMPARAGSATVTSCGYSMHAGRYWRER